MSRANSGPVNTSIAGGGGSDDPHDEPFDSNPVGIGFEAETPGSLQTVSADGDITRAKADLSGRPYVAPWSDQDATTLTWLGVDFDIGNDQAPGTDTAIDVRGAKGEQVSIQLRTPTVAAGAATFDLSVQSSNDGGTTYDTAASGSYLSVPAVAQPENVNRTYLVNVAGVTHIRLRLDINTASPASGENVTAVVNVTV